MFIYYSEEHSMLCWHAISSENQFKLINTFFRFLNRSFTNILVICEEQCLRNQKTKNQYHLFYLNNRSNKIYYFSLSYCLDLIIRNKYCHTRMSKRHYHSLWFYTMIFQVQAHENLFSTKNKTIQTLTNTS